MKSSSQNTGACFVALCKEKVVVVVVVDDYTYYPGGEVLPYITYTGMCRPTES